MGICCSVSNSLSKDKLVVILQSKKLIAHDGLPVLGYVGEHPPRISTLRDVEVAQEQSTPSSVSRMITCAMFFSL
jgi:hypothetical protein